MKIRGKSKRFRLFIVYEVKIMFKKLWKKEKEKKIIELKIEFKSQYKNFQIKVEDEKKKIKDEYNLELEKKEKEFKELNKLYEKVKYEYNYYKNLSIRLTETNEQFNDQYLSNFNNHLRIIFN